MTLGFLCPPSITGEGASEVSRPATLTVENDETGPGPGGEAVASSGKYEADAPWSLVDECGVPKETREMKAMPANKRD